MSISATTPFSFISIKNLEVLILEKEKKTALNELYENIFIVFLTGNLFPHRVEIASTPEALVTLWLSSDNSKTNTLTWIPSGFLGQWALVQQKKQTVLTIITAKS